jgi:hypothetical protein
MYPSGIGRMGKSDSLPVLLGKSDSLPVSLC